MKTKNTGLNRFIVSISALIVLIVYSACEQYVALGAGIDILPPKGEITYPDAGETPIRGNFVLKGTARDDEGVKAVSVVFEDIETRERKGPFDAQLSEPGALSVSWSVAINNSPTGNEEAPHELVKIYPVPDGEYTAIVTITDRNDKKVSINRSYKIDNTPPVFIVSRPSTVADKDDSPTTGDGYGAIFTVVGQVGEQNTVEKLNVVVPGPGLGTPIDMTNMFVGKNINAQVAVHSTAPSNPLYDLQADEPGKAIKAQMFLFDNARSYDTVSSSVEGNKAAWYYLRDDIYTDVLSKGYTAEVISDYFAGKKGSDKNDHDKKIKELRADTAALTALKDKMINMTGDGEKRSTFKLDPSKSPGFKVLGVKVLPKATLNLSHASSVLFKNGVETSFAVELVRNKDNKPIVNGSSLAAYKASDIEISLFRWNKAAGTDETDSFQTETNLIETSLLKFADLTQNNLNVDKLITVVEGGTLRVKCILPPSFIEGKYLLKVKGKDSSGEEFAAYDTSNTVTDGLYIINFLSTGSGPRIRAIRPEGFKNKNFEVFVDVTGLDAGGKVYYNVGAAVPATPDPLKILEKVNLSDPNDPKYKAAIDISSLNDAPPQNGEYKIHFLAKNPTGESDTDNTDFIVDKTAPAVEITYPDPTDPQAGSITISGSITDEKAGVKASSTKYILGKKTPAPDVTATGWQAMTTSTKGSWSAAVNLDAVPASELENDVPGSPYKKIPMYIFTEDEIGNKTVHTKHILFNPDGTKPVVRVLSPQADAVLGGTIQIFGTASAAIGGPGAVGEVYIQFSRNGSFNNATDGTFGGTGGIPSTDWYNNGNGRVITTAGAGGVHNGAEWRVIINGDKSFDNPAAGQTQQDVYFRLRAKNKNGTMGEWTSPARKITVDKSAPTIGSPHAIKIDDVLSSNPAGSSDARDYTPNMWIGQGKKLIGSLHDDAGIKAVTISSTGLKGGVNYNLTQAQAEGWIVPSSGGNFNLQIPLKLDELSAAAQSAGEFSITVSITENTVSPALISQQNFYFRFDTTDPAGDFGEHMHIDNGNFAASSITDNILADTVRAYVGTDNTLFNDLRLLIGNTPAAITGVSGDQVNFSPVLASPGNHNYILYKKKTLIYNKSGNWIVKGLANDDGSGVKEVKAKVEVNGVFSDEVTMTETDPVNKIAKQLGGQVAWQGKIDLSSLSDGKGKLHYKITDRSGNTYKVGSAYGGTKPAIDVIVKNKPFEVQTITLKTKIGGSDVDFVNTNANHAMSNVTIDKKLDFSADYKSTGFAFKDKNNSKIKVDFTGGQGQIKYKLLYNSNPLEGHGLVDMPASREITLSAANLNTIGNSDGNVKELMLELWDSAHGLTAGTDSANAKVKISTLFEAIDTIRPTVVILPFRWNGENENSLYQNKRENGHVEIGSIAAFNNNYSSVSGKVTVRGFAYDNIQLKTLKATLPNASNVSITNTDNVWNVYSDTTSNIRFEVEESDYDYLGYYVKWKLEWDSEKTGLGLEKDIKVSANDGTNDSLAVASDASAEVSGVNRPSRDKAEHTDFAHAKPGQFISFKNGEALYVTRVESVTGNQLKLKDYVPTEFKTAVLYKYTTNEPAVKVNVVPYITRIETALKGADGSFKGAFSRASTGEYPVRAGETITIKGFNLKKGKVYLGTNPTSLGTFPDDKNTVAVAVSNTYTTGDLKVSVGSVDSINNLVDVAKPYNLEGNGINNDILNARRKLFVWKMTPIINNSAMESPQFVMDSKSNYYLVFGNLKSIGSSSSAMRLSTKINGSQLDNWEVSYSKFHNTVIAYDTNGKPYLASTNTDRASNSTSFTFCFQEPSENSNYDVGKNKTRLENCDNQQTNVYDVNRAQIPKMAVKGGGTSSDPAKIALVYFDKNVKDDAPLKFRYGTVTGTESNTTPPRKVTGGIAVNVDSSGGGSDPDGPSSGSAVGYEIVANSSSVAKAGQYAGVALTASNRAIVVWYDAENSKLMYSFRDLGNSYTAPTAGGNRKTVEWQANAVEIDGGAPLYVDVALDDEENLHIGYYSSSLGGVKYAYLPKDKVTGGSKPATADFKVAVVDTFMNPGTYLKIGVRKESGKQVPYITYYHNGFYGSANAARIAWLKEGVASDGSIKTGVNNDGKFTGDWTVMTVPASSGIQQYTICNGVPTSKAPTAPVDYSGKVIAAYFTNKNYEMAVLEK
ncbi:hypothetical protein V1L52_06195 [Treponema sp. HNW]|uniref:hypothetical protein n=1 Tax=Treponema sp. HNW TaxID=3116654 RepID=UPI003D0D4315